MAKSRKAPKSPTIVRRRRHQPVSVHDMTAAPWTGAGKDGIQQKVVRVDHKKGHYLGLVAFDALTSSGLHQHQGVAASYFLCGSLTDYAGTACRGQIGLNFKGSTHDAMAYESCLLAARLEGPVTYPPKDGPLHRLHAGARHAAIVNARPEVPPELNIWPENFALQATRSPGVGRRLLFDYAGTGTDRRLVQLHLLPGASIPAHRTSELVEWFVLAGGVELGGATAPITAQGGSFVIIEPESEVTISSSYGALVLAWAEGPTRWLDRHDGGASEIYGF